MSQGLPGLFLVIVALPKRLFRRYCAYKRIAILSGKEKPKSPRRRRGREHETLKVYMCVDPLALELYANENSK
jgi:hypothetical protein